MRRLLLGLVFVLAGCGAASAPEPTDAGYITKAEYGDEWPFTIDAGTLVCTPSGMNDGRLLVTFDTGEGIQYAPNGQARDFGFPGLDATILRGYPSTVAVLPLIERGLTPCG